MVGIEGFSLYHSFLLSLFPCSSMGSPCRLQFFQETSNCSSMDSLWEESREIPAPPLRTSPTSLSDTGVPSPVSHFVFCPLLLWLCGIFPLKCISVEASPHHLCCWLSCALPRVCGACFYRLCPAWRSLWPLPIRGWPCYQDLAVDARCSNLYSLNSVQFLLLLYF